MKKIISLLLVALLTISMNLCMCACSGAKTVLTVSNNGEVKKYSLDDFEKIGTQKVSISWLNEKGEKGSQVFEGIYFNNLIPSQNNLGLNRINYTVTDCNNKTHNAERLVKFNEANSATAFIAINDDKTLSVIYPQISIDMTNKDLWVDNIKKIERTSESIVLSLSVDDYEKQYTLDELKNLKKTKQTYSWTDKDGTSGETELSGVTFRELGFNYPINDFVMVVENSDGVEENIEIDMDFHLTRVSNYLGIKLDNSMDFRTVLQTINTSEIDFPEPMIAILKNDSLLLPFPQVSGDYNREFWENNVVSISISSTAQ